MAEGREKNPSDGAPKRVLLIDNDQDIRDLVAAVLTDEGYAVTSMSNIDHEAVTAEVGRTEPDCILLDAADPLEFGRSWDSAAYLAQRARPVPTVMFTAHAGAVREAQEGESDRALAADFAAIVQKPFVIDALLDAVETAIGRSKRFDRSPAGERRRTRVLVEELGRAGASDIRTGERREWATFVPPRDERIHQLYWWQLKGLYMVGRYDEDARLEMIGRFYERDAAIRAAIGTRTAAHSA